MFLNKVEFEVKFIAEENFKKNLDCQNVTRLVTMVITSVDITHMKRVM